MSFSVNIRQHAEYKFPDFNFAFRTFDDIEENSESQVPHQNTMAPHSEIPFSACLTSVYAHYHCQSNVKALNFFISDFSSLLPVYSDISLSQF